MQLYSQHHQLNPNHQSCSTCDSNAICISSAISLPPKCQCRPGFLGTGQPNSCFSGAFCSGRFCRLNGRCVYTAHLHGYKCQCMLDCLNGGKCAIRPHKYECECAEGFTGPRCLTRTADLVREEKQDLLADRQGLFGRLAAEYRHSDNESGQLLLLDMVRKFMGGSRNWTQPAQKGLIFSYI